MVQKQRNIFLILPENSLFLSELYEKGRGTSPPKVDPGFSTSPIV